MEVLAGKKPLGSLGEVLGRKLFREECVPGKSPPSVPSGSWAPSFGEPSTLYLKERQGGAR
jgi:hypothetical protein